MEFHDAVQRSALWAVWFAYDFYLVETMLAVFICSTGALSFLLPVLQTQTVTQADDSSQ